MRPAPRRAEAKTAERPTAPSPTTAIVPPEATPPLTAAWWPVAMTSERVQRGHRLVGVAGAGDLDEGGVGERHPHRLALAAVDLAARPRAARYAAGRDARAAMGARAVRPARRTLDEEQIRPAFTETVDPATCRTTASRCGSCHVASGCRRAPREAAGYCHEGTYPAACPVSGHAWGSRHGRDDRPPVQTKEDSTHGRARGRRRLYEVAPAFDAGCFSTGCSQATATTERAAPNLTGPDPLPASPGTRTSARGRPSPPCRRPGVRVWRADVAGATGPVSQDAGFDDDVPGYHAEPGEPEPRTPRNDMGEQWRDG